MSEFLVSDDGSTPSTLDETLLQEEVVLHSPLPPESRIQRLKRRVGATLAGVALSVAGFVAVDVGSGKAAYPDNETVVSMVPGSEQIPEGGEEWLVFGGLGQVDSATPARQFYEANKAGGQNEAVASILYKNQGIDESDAQVIKHYIEKRHVKHLGIVGVSMGTPTALELLYDIRKDAADHGTTVDWKIQDIVAYSSPADGHDPWQSDLLHKAAQSDYPGGMLSKFGYNVEPNRLLSPFLSREERIAQLKHGLKQTFNDCSPALFMSQVKLLDGTDIGKWSEFTDTFESNVGITYLAGENRDDTVNDDSAIQKLSTFTLKVINGTWQLIEVANAGHADTARSAAAFGKFLLDQLVAQQGGDKLPPGGLTDIPRHMK